MKKLAGILLLAWIPVIGFSQGCVDVGDDEEGAKIIGFIQPEYKLTLDDVNSNTFQFERARLGVTGNIPYDFKYYFMAEFSPIFSGDPQAPGNPFLLDAFVSYNRYLWAQGALGQFKSPVGLEFLTPCHKLHTIYRSKFVINLGSPLRDLGFQVYGGNDTTLIKYQVAIMNGSGINFIDQNSAKDYLGRLLFQPFKGKLMVGGNVRFGTPPPEEGSGVDEDGERTRYGLEARFHTQKFNIQAEYMYGKDVGSYITGGGCGGGGEIVTGEIERSGWYVMAYYMTDWRLEPVVKVEQYNRDMNVTDAVDWITTIGISYFFNDWTRLQINYMYKAELDEEIDNDCLAIQIQASF
jgi:phosphate-selective porin